MSKYLNHSERITSYLDGQMTSGQMQEFEKQLHTDPVLRSEFELQNDIIHSIKDFRKDQLKTRLDQVPVNAGPGMLVGVKTAAALVISGIVGLGAYLYFNTPEDQAALVETIEPVKLHQVQPKILNELPEVLPLKEQPTASTSIESEAVPESTSIASGETSDVESTARVKTITDINKETTPVINSPKLVNPDLDHTEVEESIDIPTAALAQEGLIDNSVVAVETNKKDSDLFHYQYFSGKLYLYGDFRDNPYEILELNSANGKRLFIYYNNAYYKIMDDQRQITPLVELTDPDIIKKLEIIQANK